MMNTERETAGPPVRFADEDPTGEPSRARARAREDHDNRSETAHQTAPTDVTDSDDDRRENFRPWWQVLAKQFRPPEPWQHRPASCAAMWRYAWRGAWTGPEVRQVRPAPPKRTVTHHENPLWTSASTTVTESDGPVEVRTRQPVTRRLGVWYFRLIALPATVVLHYAAWIVARPSRLVVGVGLWAVLMQVPALRTVAEVLLPWNPWLWPWGGA
jgi:hypothetical protein